MKKIFFVNISILLIIFLLFEITLRVFTNITPQGVSKGIINQSINPIFNFPNINGKKVLSHKFTLKSKDPNLPDDKKLDFVVTERKIIE